MSENPTEIHNKMIDVLLSGCIVGKEKALVRRGQGLGLVLYMTGKYLGCFSPDYTFVMFQTARLVVADASPGHRGNWLIGYHNNHQSWWGYGIGGMEGWGRAAIRDCAL